MILIDLEKAFERINHEIIFRKPASSLWKNIVWCPAGFFPRTLLFLIYVNDMAQFGNSNMFLYVDNSCLMFQHKDVEEIVKVLDNEFGNICDWFLHSGEDKTQSILFAGQHKIKNMKNL